MYKGNDLNPQTTDQLKAVIWAKILWKERKVFLKTIIIAGVLGLLISLFSPKEYVSWTTMVPQTSNPASKLSGISSLAAMAGFNLDMAAGEQLSPAVYPQIVGSVLYQMELMNKPFHIEGADQPVTLFTYYNEYAKLGLIHSIGEYISEKLDNLTEAISGSNKPKNRVEGSPVFLTKKEEKIRKLIEKQITLNVDIKNGYITLYSSFPEAELSAEVADYARELLQLYIIKFKIKKATDQLTFIEGRYKEKKEEFLKIQKILANFRDQNKNISSAIAATEEEKLKSEYSIALSVYNELTKQLEQAKIQVKEDTPAFSVIQPAKVPLEKSKPKRLLILVVWFFFGLIVGAGIIFGKQLVPGIKETWNESV